MFGLFGKSKKKAKKSAGAKAAAQKPGGRPTREEIMKEAMANARHARQEIGEENLQRIAAAFRKKEQNSAAIQEAKRKIEALDQDRVADNIRAIIKDE